MLELAAGLVVGFLVLVWLGIVAFGPPYVPTLSRNLEQCCDELRLGPKNHVIDLGAGDGRVLAAAARRGARASGVELNPCLVWIARWRLRRWPQTQVAFGNMWQYRLPQGVTHVFVFPAQSFMVRLERYLVQQAKDHHFTAVIYAFKLPDRKPTKTRGPFNLYQF